MDKHQAAERGQHRSREPVGAQGASTAQRQVASDYAERISAKGEQLMSMHEDWIDAAREYVRENPFQALGIALAAGYLIHLITSRD